MGGEAAISDVRPNHQRQSNLELLRIIAMLMIVAYHYVIHGQSNHWDLFLWNQKLFLNCFSIFGKVGVNLFVLISGYFSINKTFKVKKVIELDLQTVFFSVVIMISLYLFGNEPFSLKTTIFSVAPVIFNQYWFITAYVVLYLLSPWYNNLLLNLKKESFQKMLCVMCVIWSVIPYLTFQPGSGFNLTQQIWMFVMYAFGAYIKRFSVPKIKYERILTLGFGIALIGSVLMIDVVGLKVPAISDFPLYFGWSNSVFALPFSVLLFQCFEKMNLGLKKWINLLSSSALSVYLLHENPLLSTYIWDLCKPWKGIELIWKSIVIIFIVYFLGFLSDLVWKIMNKLCRQYIEWVEKAIKKVNQSIWSNEL